MLTERILTIETAEGMLPATLPEALARLCDKTLIAFDGLAAHQRHAWDLFLFQTAAMALARNDEAEAANDDAAWGGLADPDTWRRYLAALTPRCADTAWSLVVDDFTQPAFMQPPIGVGSLAGYTLAGQTADEIDVLVTSKGHDVKAARASAAEPRHWLFALVTLQTLQGYSGRHPPTQFYWGIARMNGGSASRPMVMLTPSPDLPTRFRRGVLAALAARASALRLQGGYYRADGVPLLWLNRWDIDEGLSLADLDPLFVEICRRIRLVRNAAGQIAAWGRPSEVARVAVSKEAKGNLGDAWTPVSIKDNAALTVGAGGFDYRLVNRLIASQEFQRPAAMVPHPADRGALWLHAAVLVRGQGKTEGFHERWLRIPAKARSLLATETIDRLSKSMIADAESAKKALRFGLQSFLQGGPEKIDFKDNRPQSWSATLDQEIDRIFFDHLFARAEDSDDSARADAWREALCETTRHLFTQATDRLDPPQSRRERARAVSSRTFEGMLRKAALIRSTAPEGGTAEETQP
jgi:CRISPR system Cascade subunit CasA